MKLIKPIKPKSNLREFLKTRISDLYLPVFDKYQYPCPSCDGKGYIKSYFGYDHDIETCDFCGGEGDISKELAAECQRVAANKYEKDMAGYIKNKEILERFEKEFNKEERSVCLRFEI